MFWWLFPGFRKIDYLFLLRYDLLCFKSLHLDIFKVLKLYNLEKEFTFDQITNLELTDIQPIIPNNVLKILPE